MIDSDGGFVTLLATMVRSLASLLIVVAVPAFAAAPAELPDFAFGGGCRYQSVDGGKAERMTFTEARLECGVLRVTAEVIKPVGKEAADRQITNEVIRMQESYSATRNPYAGFISNTAQCPTKRNFSRDEFQFNNSRFPLLTGRLTPRGAWGGCSAEGTDHWGAVTFLVKGDVMMKVTVKSREKLAREEFNRQTLALLRSIKGR